MAQRIYCLDCGQPKARPRNDSKWCRSCAAKRKWATGVLTPTPSQRVTLTCEVCGASFEVIPARVGKARTCSRRCAHIVKTWITGDAHPLKLPPSVHTCEQCGKRFEAKACFADPAKGKRFCSRGCVGGWVTSHNPRSSSIEDMTASYLDDVGAEYQRQVSIGRFTADFVVGTTVIEVDGTYWHAMPQVAARDIRKDVAYAALGLRTVHLSEASIRAGDFSAIAHLGSAA